MSQSHARLGQTSLTLFLALQSSYWPIPAYSFSLASFMSLSPSASPKLNENTDLRQNQARVHQVGLWFDDGNIILIAEDTPFKVHRSLLSNKSEVFRDMFSLPQPDILDDSELMDGIPIVYMSDNWRDLAFVLKALYDSIQLFNTQVQIPFAMVSAFVRLGTKYGLAELRELAVHWLQQSFPSDYITFRDRTSHDLASRQDAQLFNTQSPILLWTADAIAVVNLARAYNIPSILPAAFYLCSRLPPKKLLEGVMDIDGNRSILSTADQARCWNGQLELDRQYTLAVQDLRNAIAGEDCEDVDGDCGEMKKDDNDRAMYNTMGCCFAKAFWLNLDIGEGLCNGCYRARLGVWNEFQQRIWASLPDIFDLRDYIGEATSVLAI